MDLAPDPKLEGTINLLIERFTPIYEEWTSKQTPPVTADAHECLYKDLYMLGKTIAGADKVGQKAELNLLAEVLVLVKQEKNPMPYEYIVETVDKEIGSANASPADFSAIPALMSARILREWTSGHLARQAPAQEVAEAMMEIVNQFVMRDGNLSKEEISIANALEKQFAL